MTPTNAPNRTAHPLRSAHVAANGQQLGALFELHPSLLERGRGAILYLDLDKVLALPSQRQNYQPLRRFPTSSFDLSIVAGSHELVANLEKNSGSLPAKGSYHFSSF